MIASQSESEREAHIRHTTEEAAALSDLAKALTGRGGFGPQTTPDEDASRRLLEAKPALTRAPRALALAIRHGAVELAEALLAAGADANCALPAPALGGAETWPLRPLHAVLLALGAGRLTQEAAARLLRGLVEAGAEIDAVGGRPAARPIYLAAIQGNLPAARLLLDLGARRDPIAAAALLDRDSLATWLKEDPGAAGAVEPGGLTPLHYLAGSRLAAGQTAKAATKGADGLAALSALAAAGAPLDLAGGDTADLDLGWATPLALAISPLSGAMGAWKAAMERLLSHGARPDSGLVCALSASEEGIARRLVEAGADPDGSAPGTTRPLLHALIFAGRSAAVRLLLELGAKPDRRDAEGRTALVAAASLGLNPTLLKLLIERGADTRARGPKGETLLELAEASGRPGLAETLKAWAA